MASRFGGLVASVGRFEAELLRNLRDQGKDILDGIRDKKELTKELGDRLKAAMDTFAKGFVA